MDSRVWSVALGSLCAVCAMACGSAQPPHEGGDEIALTRAALGSAPALVPVPQPSNDYTLFETLQVRPLSLSPNGKLLFAVNTPDNRLEIFNVGRNGISHLDS